MSWADKHKTLSLITYIEAKVLKIDRKLINKDKYSYLSDSQLHTISWELEDSYEIWLKSGVNLKEFEPLAFIDDFKK